MAKSEYIECTYCGATNDKSSERCKKCGKYHTEDAEEFEAYINHEYDSIQSMKKP